MLIYASIIQTLRSMIHVLTQHLYICLPLCHVVDSFVEREDQHQAGGIGAVGPETCLVLGRRSPGWDCCLTMRVSGTQQMRGSGRGLASACVLCP
jgi:hypothetical protein